MENLFDTSFLFASLLWGSVGMGYFIYGKKQSATMPMIGGVVICAVSYVVSSWFLMTLLSIGIIVAIHWLIKRGY